MSTEELAEQPLEVVERDGIEYTLLGTAHVSRASADAVRQHISEGHYDAIAIELCDSRHHAMQNPDAWQQTDLFQIIRQGKAGLVAANLALGAYQRRIAEQFGIEPGAEMRAAIEESEKAGLPVVLIDRDVGITLKRVYRKAGFFEKMAIFGGLISSLVSREEISEQDIEALKEGDILESTFAEFANQSEHLYEGLIAERDRYMSARLRESSQGQPWKKVLVVIGAGHLQGTRNELRENQTAPSETLAELVKLPPASRFLKFLPWLITLLVLSGFAIGFSRNTDLGLNLVATWVLVNGSLSALGTLIAGGHPVSIATAFFAAPVTSLNPTIGAGVVVAGVEVSKRKPTVADFQGLRDDVTRLSGWWNNRVSRTLLVFMFANLGSAAGTWIAGLNILGKLG